MAAKEMVYSEGARQAVMRRVSQRIDETTWAHGREGLQERLAKPAGTVVMLRATEE